MKIKLTLGFLSLIIGLVFLVFSYTVAREMWQQVDFDTTVKLQDHISRRFDTFFSYFSLLGSAEVIFSIVGILIVINLFKLRLIPVIGWLIVLPASVVEIIGKLVIFHPAPPVLFHRTINQTNLPSFYIHTNFSYPSGHLIRTSFLLTVLLVIILLGKKKQSVKLLLTLGLLTFGLFMVMTRLYLGEHWLSDVLGGTLLGCSAGLFASSLILSKNTNLVLKN